MTYFFGFPDVMVDFHFPEGKDQSRTSLPWYWWIGPPAQPSYFVYLGGPWGPGWLRMKIAPIIKILPEDTQVETPTPVLGFAADTVKAPAGNPNAQGLQKNAPLDPVGLVQAMTSGATPDVSWGRFKFTDQFFWDVLGKKKPQFSVVQGKPTQIIPPNTKNPPPPISKTISDAVKDWKSRWNFGAAAFNTQAQLACDTNHIDPVYPFPVTKFAVPLPTSTVVSDLSQAFQAGEYYLGPVPGGFWFEQGSVQIFKQAYSFSMQVGQLSLDNWDQSTFPPTPLQVGPITKFSASQDCSGYGQSTFPLAGPQIIGGG